MVQNGDEGTTSSSSVKSAVTLKDVARAAGVSLTTASVALSGEGRLSEGTRRQVQATAREMGYVGNAAARHLRAGSHGALAVDLPSEGLDLEYYVKFAFGATQRARDRGYSTVLLAPNAAADGSGLQVDGLILADPRVDDERSEALIKSGKPTVVSGEMPSHLEVAGTVQDQSDLGMRELLEHFAARGVKNPWFMAPARDSSWGRVLQEEYLAWCIRHEVEPRMHIASFRATPAQIQDASLQFFSQAQPRDGLICASFAAAIVMSRHARARGLSVGDDILIASCSDHTSTAYESPELTVIDLQPHENGMRCADLLIDLINGDAVPGTKRTSPVKLVIRASSSGKKQRAAG